MIQKGQNGIFQVTGMRPKMQNSPPEGRGTLINFMDYETKGTSTQPGKPQSKSLQETPW